uniref:Uncharacterized protein n=1 Tax=Anguilla anguilla TaxID=7936 RepID=A0A0E9VBV1_ANGAN
MSSVGATMGERKAPTRNRDNP